MKLSFLASLAFINIGKRRAFLDAGECSFEKLLSEFFSSSCAPGANDTLHQSGNTPLAANLCSLCTTTVSARGILTEGEIVDDQIENADIVPEENPEEAPVDSQDGVDEVITESPLLQVEGRQTQTRSCNADSSNIYFGTRGALQCLYESGDVAIVEVQNLEAHAKAINADSSNFRILCQNGSLASTTGFNVDSACYLTSIVDGEIIVRRNDFKSQGIRTALLSLDRYLLHDPSFRMYNIFNSEKNLLFQDSTLGLTTGEETNVSPSVDSYKKLFQDVDNCVQATGSWAAPTNAFNYYILLVSLFFVIFRF